MARDITEQLSVLVAITLIVAVGILGPMIVFGGH